MGPDSRRGRSPEPSLGAFSIIEEVDIVACVREDKLEEVEHLNLEAGLRDHRCDSDIPGRPKFGGIVRQAIDAGQRDFGHRIGAIHQDERGFVFVQQVDGFRDLRLAFLVQELVRDDEQDQVISRNVFNCPRHDDLSRKLCN